MTHVAELTDDRDRRALPDLIAERLIAAVSDGTLQPGEQLPIETELARQMGVGRTSLREAIQKLRAMGVVEVRKGLGTFVVDSTRMEPVHSFVKWSADNEFEVTELFEARMSLETTAASLAAQRADRDDLQRLEQAAARHQIATDIEELIASDEAFHQELVSCSHNSLIARLYSLLVPGLREFRRMSLAIPASANRSSVSHFDIVAAISSGDSVQSRRATVRHLLPLYAAVTSAANSAAAGDRRDRADNRVLFMD